MGRAASGRLFRAFPGAGGRNEPRSGERQAAERGAGTWKRRQYTNLVEHVCWIPFGDHPLKLERYRED